MGLYSRFVPLHPDGGIPSRADVYRGCDECVSAAAAVHDGADPILLGELLPASQDAAGGDGGDGGDGSAASRHMWARAFGGVSGRRALGWVVGTARLLLFSWSFAIPSHHPPNQPTQPRKPTNPTNHPNPG